MPGTRLRQKLRRVRFCVRRSFSEARHKAGHDEREKRGPSPALLPLGGLGHRGRQRASKGTTGGIAGRFLGLCPRGRARAAAGALLAAALRQRIG